MFILGMLILLVWCWMLKVLIYGDGLDWLQTNWFYVVMAVFFVVMCIPLIVNLWG